MRSSQLRTECKADDSGGSNCFSIARSGNSEVDVGGGGLGGTENEMKSIQMDPMN